MKRAAHAAKIALLGAFVLQPGAWDSQAEQWSRLLPHDWPGEHGDRLGQMVLDGSAQLVDLHRDGERVAMLVYVIDEHFPRPEMVIVAAYSGFPRVDVTTLCLAELREFAARKGCATLRFHTMRPGLIRKALAAGGRISEVIVRFDCHA